MPRCPTHRLHDSSHLSQSSPVLKIHKPRAPRRRRILRLTSQRRPSPVPTYDPLQFYVNDILDILESGDTIDIFNSLCGYGYTRNLEILLVSSENTPTANPQPSSSFEKQANSLGPYTPMNTSNSHFGVSASDPENSTQFSVPLGPSSEQPSGSDTQSAGSEQQISQSFVPVSQSSADSATQNNGAKPDQHQCALNGSQSVQSFDAGRQNSGNHNQSLSENFNNVQQDWSLQSAQNPQNNGGIQHKHGSQHASTSSGLGGGQQPLTCGPQQACAGNQQQHASQAQPPPYRPARDLMQHNNQNPCASQGGVGDRHHSHVQQAAPCYTSDQQQRRTNTWGVVESHPHSDGCTQTSQNLPDIHRHFLNRKRHQPDSPFFSSSPGYGKSNRLEAFISRHHHPPATASSSASCSDLPPCPQPGPHPGLPLFEFPVLGFSNLEISYMTFNSFKSLLHDKGVVSGDFTRYITLFTLFDDILLEWLKGLNGNNEKHLALFEEDFNGFLRYMRQCAVDRDAMNKDRQIMSYVKMAEKCEGAFRLN